MFEIFVGFLALVILYRIFPGHNSKGPQTSILPFLEDEFQKNKNQPEAEYYDWADNMKDDFGPAGEDGFDDPGEEYFENEPFSND